MSLTANVDYIEASRRAKEQAEELDRRARESMKELKLLAEKEVDLINKEREALHAIEAGIEQARGKTKEMRKLKKD